MDTKACSLTENEIKVALGSHALKIVQTNDITNIDINDHLERMNYLNKRLKAFNEPEKIEDKPKSTMTDTQSDAVNAAVASNSAPKGW